MLAQRLLTAAIGIPVILALIYVGDDLYTIVVAAILAIAAIEFVRMALDPDATEAAEAVPFPASIERAFSQLSPSELLAAMGVMAIAIGADGPDEHWTVASAFIASMGLAFVYIIAMRKLDNELGEWATIVTTLAYVGILGSYFVLLRGLDEDGTWVFWAVLATWGADTCAYAVGKQFGRHKMAPSISPGKTWEGTAGGLAGGFAIVVALGLALPDLPVSTVEAIILGLLLPGVAVIADLGESCLKRGAGVKDTSVLIPGHGGFLDRLDSLLFTVPLVYYFAVWVVL